MAQTNQQKERSEADKKFEQINIAPHSIEAEQAILGGIMLNSETLDSVAERIQPSDFYNKTHEFIFSQMLQLAKEGQPIDLLTIDQALKDKGILEDAGRFAYLAELSKNTPSVANILAYADIVSECAIRRELISASNKIAEISYSPKGMTVKDVLDEAERTVFHIAEKRTSSDEGPKKIDSILMETLSRIEMLSNSKNNGGVTGVSTGFIDLDKRTAGLQPSDLIIVAARPSMGKTTFAMNLCENASMLDIEVTDENGNVKKVPNKPVLIFSLEMPAEQIMMRMFASLSRVNQTKIRTGQLEDEEDMARIASTVAMLQERANIYIDDSSGLTPTELRSRARRVYKDNGGLSLIMVDYLQLMRAPGFADNRTLEIAEISRSLKALAKELEVPVVALSQLNRSLEQRADKRPVNSDLRESGSIEQDADLIMFIYRDEVYHENSEKKGIAEIIIGKQRNGPIGRVPLTFNGQWSRFDNYTGNAYNEED
ncbi:replicative DNA helicase [Bibersteinia trehalosi]|uniref:Replicative DNA helicase n=4 Tax=Bibersteinia trehalosi TaxID=47735 RepID=W0R5Z4_BIBTR|nr:replicative DNA helicase [Bibersteinia trehalosi]AGH38585.1 Replicative DNA helicase [Bibersteinia trehalosi USDA-ARS-USMARC-192]AHG86569.1 Replicative DNA helicase [Bibersteinia trehalosi USDA-ARS-USMARC-190]OAQ14777.1 DNA helicase [Bibersteinia trehalosi Y31]RRN04819.1 replicative DNA helicase [Bibersteinia trehalosi]TCT17726.1 primary replicative DNA helicase [Bibersteinia trehalosi]